MEIEYGYCHCGCGEKTNIAQQSRTKRGIVRGEPYMFIGRHNTRLRIVPVPLRFWPKVDQSADMNSCWNWTACRNRQGYGMFDKSYAHRVAWELTYGEIPNGLYVCHHCDNPTCCNPNHLFLGTHDDNMKDKVSKDKQIRGEQMPQHVLNETGVKYIRERYAKGGITQSKLANEMGVKQATIWDILHYRKWKHVA